MGVLWVELSQEDSYISSEREHNSLYSVNLLLCCFPDSSSHDKSLCHLERTGDDTILNLEMNPSSSVS